MYSVPGQLPVQILALHVEIILYDNLTLVRVTANQL